MFYDEKVQAVKWRAECKASDRRRDNFLKVFESYVAKDFGPRCKDFEPECPCCKMWRMYDNAKNYVC